LKPPISTSGNVLILGYGTDDRPVLSDNAGGSGDGRVRS
jgi:hypothetical protein